MEERAFLALGEGAERWLIAAAAAGAQRVRRKMAEAVDLAKLHGQEPVERALATCAQAGRFADGDLQAILAPPAATGGRGPAAAPGLRGVFAAALDPLVGGVRTMNTTESRSRRLKPTRREARGSGGPPGRLARDRGIAYWPARPDRELQGHADRGSTMTVKPPAPPPLPDELEQLLRRMRLPYIRRAAPEVLATAAAQRWEHAEVLRVLLSEEVKGREQATIRTRRRASGLPAGKTFDAWEPDRSAIPTKTQRALQTLEWIDRAEVLVVCGPSGTGKSHLVEALGHLAIDNGKTVAWHTLETLAQLLRRHRADDSINKAIGKLIRADLVVVDDVGLLPDVRRRRRGAVPRDRRRLRETIDRDLLQHSPVRVRRTDAQKHRDRDRRPATPPRPRDHHQGNATLNYRSVLARELTAEDAEIYRRPGHRRRLRRVSAAGEGASECLAKKAA